jgi:two-component system, chemotaxis family, sensor kinase CheA
MPAREDEFLRQLRATFKVEAGEHLQTIASGLLELEKIPPADEQRRQIELVFRAAHSLKGAARAVNFTEVESVCQSLEDLFADWKNGRTKVSPEALDTGHRALDVVSGMLTDSAPTATESAAPAKADRGAETVRIAVDKLDARLLEAEEMLSAKLVVAQRSVELAALVDQFEPWRKAWTRVQPQARALRSTNDYAALSDFLEWSQDYLRLIENKVNAVSRSAQQDRLTVGKLVDDLLADSKQLLKLPLATVSALFPKVVRDLCRDQGKEADLVMHGEEIEIDKRILEEMKDPLLHLLRNCVDHGIESPQQRINLGKPARATLRLDVTVVNGSQVQILLSDDGAGVDVETLKASALKRGLLTRPAAERLSESEALDLIFLPDVSTSPIITELSGRGLGLAIVREKTEKLGGRVTVQSRRGSGTRIRVLLPVTLATFRGILIGVAERTFVLPTAEVERVMRFRPADVKTVEGRETLALDGRALALVQLADVLDLPTRQAHSDAAGATPAVILGTDQERVAFAIDAVLDEQEILFKQLSSPLTRVRYIAGATVLGNGQVAPVLRIADLLKAAKRAGAPTRAAPAAKPATQAQAKTILLAEDSITSRLLLKGILESAGYRVKTAVDGADAFSTLRTEHFDLLISDVEMPRLNGFDLTAQVRADKKLAELPVVLVTALESRRDREAGINAGANAYLVKSTFDQSNLLDTVRRLI